MSGMDYGEKNSKYKCKNMQGPWHSDTSKTAKINFITSKLLLKLIELDSGW